MLGCICVCVCVCLCCAPSMSFHFADWKMRVGVLDRVEEQEETIESDMLLPSFLSFVCVYVCLSTASNWIYNNNPSAFGRGRPWWTRLSSAPVKTYFSGCFEKTYEKMLIEGQLFFWRLISRKDVVAQCVDFRVPACVCVNVCVRVRANVCVCVCVCVEGRKGRGLTIKAILDAFGW